MSTHPKLLLACCTSPSTHIHTTRRSTPTTLTHTHAPLGHSGGGPSPP